MDNFAIIKHPLTTESAMKKIEDTNTLVFIVDILANKPQIKTAAKQLYNIDPVKVSISVILDIIHLFTCVVMQISKNVYSAGEHFDHAVGHQEGVREAVGRARRA